MNGDISEELDALEAVNEHYYSLRQTDGLPIIPPTEDRVGRMLSAAGLPGEEVVGLIPPRWAEATAEKVAVNAVMAGCLPEYFPVVVAAVKAISEKPFNLYGLQATTNPVAPLLIVNGPAAGRLEMNGGYNCLGQGNRANATIGRAVRLVMMNLGGGLPGTLDRATAGQPGKYTFCLAENEDANPWQPLHVERGFAVEQSTVTAVGAAGTTNIIDMYSKTAEGVLDTISGSMNAVGTNNILMGGEPLVLLCPEHAAIISRGGFDKEGVKSFLFEKSKAHVSSFSREALEGVLVRREARGLSLRGEDFIPVADKPDDIMIVVAGGAGPHSVFIPTFGGDTCAVTVPIADG
jgi:hypothetical protein